MNRIGSKQRSASITDVKLYLALTAARKPMPTGDLAKLNAVTLSVVSHTLKTWHRQGLVKRTFMDRRAWWSWQAPKTAEAKSIADALADAANLMDAVGPKRTRGAPPEVNPLVVVLEHVGNALLAAAAELKASAE